MPLLDFFESFCGSLTFQILSVIGLFACFEDE